MTPEWKAWNESPEPGPVPEGPLLDYYRQKLASVEEWDPPSLAHLRGSSVLGIWRHSHQSGKANWFVTTSARVENLTLFHPDSSFGRDALKVSGWGGADRSPLRRALVSTRQYTRPDQPKHRYCRVVVELLDHMDTPLMTDTVGYYEEGGFLAPRWGLPSDHGTSFAVRIRPESEVSSEAAALVAWFNPWLPQ